MSRRRLSNLGFAAVLVGTACTACTANDPTRAPAAAATSQPAVGCDFQVDNGPLPEWARAGFEGDSAMPHVMGRRTVEWCIVEHVKVLFCCEPGIGNKPASRIAT